MVSLIQSALHVMSVLYTFYVMFTMDYFVSVSLPL